MCNLYSQSRSRDEVARWFGVDRARYQATNQPPATAIFPDRMAPIVRIGPDGQRVIEEMRWGFPPPPTAGNRPVTNVRNTSSSHWRAWLKPEFRCLVPATSFSEYTDTYPKMTHWFALDDRRPIFAFAGIWRPWSGARGTKAEPVIGDHRLFSFLTTDANDVVRPIHSKAMPVMLATPADCDAWLTAEPDVAVKMQKPFPAEGMKIVARGLKQDSHDEAPA